MAPRAGDYHIRARPLGDGQPGRYTITFRLHPWRNIDGPPLPEVQ